MTGAFYFLTYGACVSLYAGIKLKSSANLIYFWDVFRHHLCRYSCGKGAGTMNEWKCIYSWTWYDKYHFYFCKKLEFQIHSREVATVICEALKIELPSGEAHDR